MDRDHFHETDVALYILGKNPKLAFLRDAKEETALHALACKPLQPVANELSIWKSMTVQRKYTRL